MLALVLAAAAAAAPVPGAPLRGVELRIAAGGELTILVTRRARPAWAALAGEPWSIGCTSIAPAFGDAPAPAGATGLVDPGRLHVHTGLYPGRLHADLCGGIAGDGAGLRTVPTRVFSELGRITLDVGSAASVTASAIAAVQAAYAAGGAVPAAASLPGAVGLPTADATPPPAPAFGYYSDAPGHAAVSSRTPAGRVVTWSFDAPDVVSTNVVAYVDLAPRAPVPLVPIAAMAAGVTASAQGSAVSFTLPPALVAALGGRAVITCLRLGPRGATDAYAQTLAASPAVSFSPPHAGSSPFDACRLATAETVVARVPLSDAGRRYLEREQARHTLIGALGDAELLGAPGGARFAAATALAQLGPVVALTAPGAPFDAGSVGYLTDGATSAYAATVSSDGRVLFAERDGDVLRSNVLLGP